MASKMFTRCCRLCFDEEKQHKEITSVEQLPKTLERLYNVKISKNDRLSKNICVDCEKEAEESLKWLEMYEDLKKQVLANQERFQTEVREQLGSPTPPPVDPPKSAQTVSTRSARLSRRAGAIDEEPVKAEPVTTRNTRSKREEEPHSEAEHSETPTSTDSSNGNEEEDEEEATSETGTTSTEVEPRCPRCETVFADIVELEKHSCKFICSVCSMVMSYKMSLKRHLIKVHKVSPSQWESYWNPLATATEEQDLLVVAKKPRKRYRYESDSPTDMEDEDVTTNNDQVATSISKCRYCRTIFDEETTRDVCRLCCDICGSNFSSMNNMKRHKIKVHKISKEELDASVPLRRTPSRARSRAVSEAESDDDEPLSALTARDGQSDTEWSGGRGGFRYLCPDCDYTNNKRYRVTTHMRVKHGIPADQIDPETIVKKMFEERSATPSVSRHSRPQTPKSATTETSRSRPSRSHTPKSSAKGETPKPIVSPKLTQDNIDQALLTQMPAASGHRSRARSTCPEDMDRKRKRSPSACSTKSLNWNRSRPTTPTDRPVLVAKRRNIDSGLLSQVHQKYRPTMISIQSNRLVVAAQSQQNCTPTPLDSGTQMRIRVSSYQPPDPCATRKLFRRRGAAGQERALIGRLRQVFQTMSNSVNPASTVNDLDVDSLVLVPNAEPQPDIAAENPLEPMLDPLQRLSTITDGNTEFVVIQVQESEEIEETVTEYHEEETEEVVEDHRNGADEFVEITPEAIAAYQQEDDEAEQQDEFITSDDVCEAGEDGTEEGVQITPD